MSVISAIQGNPSKINVEAQKRLKSAVQEGLASRVTEVLKENSVAPYYVAKMLKLAAQSGQRPVIPPLLEHGRLDCRTVIKSLKWACEFDQWDTAEAIARDSRIGKEALEQGIETAHKYESQTTASVLENHLSRLPSASKSGSKVGHKVFLHFVEMNKNLIKAAKEDNEKWIRLHLKEQHIDSAGVNSALQASVKRGNKEIVQMLLADKRVTLGGLYKALEESLVLIARDNQTECFEELLKDERVKGSSMLQETITKMKTWEINALKTTHLTSRVEDVLSKHKG